MRYDDFVKAVQERMSADESETAIAAVEATFETLGERLTDTERKNLGAQLPDELQAFLAEREHTQRFLLEDFYKRVSSRSNVSYHTAVDHSREVIAVLKEAISDGEVEDLRSQLPSEYGELFGDPPADSLSATQ